jgi:hypothetical protein
MIGTPAGTPSLMASLSSSLLPCAGPRHPCPCRVSMTHCVHSPSCSRSRSLTFAFGVLRICVHSPLHLHLWPCICGFAFVALCLWLCICGFAFVASHLCSQPRVRVHVCDPLHLCLWPRVCVCVRSPLHLCLCLRSQPAPCIRCAHDCPLTH